jgi:hypothetical protein
MILEIKLLKLNDFMEDLALTSYQIRLTLSLLKVEDLCPMRMTCHNMVDTSYYFLTSLCPYCIWILVESWIIN